MKTVRDIYVDAVAMKSSGVPLSEIRQRVVVAPVTIVTTTPNEVVWPADYNGRLLPAGEEASDFRGCLS